MVRFPRIAGILICDSWNESCGIINLLTEEIQGDFDQYIFPILEAWFQEFKEELISMWNNKETYILPEWG